MKKKLKRLSRCATVYFRTLPRNIHGISLHDDIHTDIWIDLKRQTSPARVFLHELLHREHPRASETIIRTLESKIWNRMSQRERYELYRNLFSRKWRTKSLNINSNSD